LRLQEKEDQGRRREEEGKKEEEKVEREEPPSPSPRSGLPYPPLSDFITSIDLFLR